MAGNSASRQALVARSGHRPAGALLLSVGSVLVVGTAGCSLWRGDLDAAHNRYVQEQIRDIRQANLRSSAIEPTVSVEEDLPSMLPRRNTGYAQNTLPAQPTIAASTRRTSPPSPTTRPAEVEGGKGVDDLATPPAAPTTLPGGVATAPAVVDLSTPAQPAANSLEATRPVGSPSSVAQPPATRPSASSTQPAVPPLVPAGPAVPLKVSDLRMNMLRTNLDLAVVAIDPQIARTQITEEEARFDALITGGVRYKRESLPRLDGPVVELGPGGDVVKETEIAQTKEALNADLGIEVPLPTGAKIKVQSIFDEDVKFDPKKSEQYLTGMKFSISQPLLRNAGFDANLAPIRVARLSNQAVEARTKLSAIRVLALGEKAYWNVYASRRALDIRAQQYNLAYDNLELVRKRVKEGFSPAIEIIRAEVGVTSRLESLIQAETTYRLQQRELKRIMNDPSMPLDSESQIEIASSPELIRLRLDREALVNSALSSRMEMLELELNLAADAIRVDLARNQALPLFMLDFDYGVLDRETSRGSAFGSMFDFDNTGFAIGLRGEIPVTNDARRARLRRALLTRSQRLATRQLRELAIRQEVYDVVDVLNQNWQRILAARQNVIVSGVNYEAELKQFNEGLRTMREVLEALTQLGDAQLREVQAVQAYQVAQIDLAFATGTLLGYAGVGLDGLPVPTVPASTDTRVPQP
jgi:outer membrane protein TolC